MGAHFPAIELENTIQFSTLSRMSGFPWRSYKWARLLGFSFNTHQGLKCYQVNMLRVITLKQFLIFTIVLMNDLLVLAVFPFFRNIECLFDKQTWSVSEKMFSFDNHKTTEKS